MPAELRALDQLEQLVDQFKLSGVIEMLRDVCEVKKEHIIETWQDRATCAPVAQYDRLARNSRRRRETEGPVSVNWTGDKHLEHGDAVTIRRISGDTICGIFDQYRDGRYVRVLVQDEDNQWHAMDFDRSRILPMPKSGNA